ncbi:two-component system, chemotaxis family, sensor kinase CheA [Desulfonatronum thiosulfatophilum]|uniref:Two-component system, chemotaxis family, sensor kinase CheA n=1 Tax=Desulfonatronum thiosulfatophilum TaxID=617002 RepID=A0A1G6DCM3_9BACT|nr:Hpt domain-containing protein [Desulfonatronum thiosulfatophilum]SDB42886.1 two-component system, chemotaxis family, sensor kinase CheA [Desulfonatronum thiosulfatophilum]
MSDDLMAAFIEDSKEHLESIEADIMALENLSGAYDEELINRIFRTAHSIKGAAGFFGLDAIGSLSHKLENALHLMRDQKLRTDRQTCQILLEGFDQLSAMINDPEQSKSMHTDPILLNIQALLTPETKISTETALILPSPQGHSIFDVDMFTLDQGLKGGKYLYHIEFDLIHDIHRKDRTPYEIIKTLQDSGLILDCKIDFEATGTLENGFAQMIPLNVLFASIIDPDVIGMLLDVPGEKIRELDKSMFHRRLGAADNDQPGIVTSQPGTSLKHSLAVCSEANCTVLILSEKFDLSKVERFRESLVDALRQSAHLCLDMSETRHMDAAAVQVVASALKTCISRNGSLCLTPPPSETLREQFQGLGFAWLLERAT